MKRFIRSFSGIILSLLILIGAFAADGGLIVHADSVDVSISISSSSIRIGQSVDVTISVSGSTLSAYTMYISYSADVLEFAGATGTVGGGGGTLTASGAGPGSVTVSFTAIANGTAYISTGGEEFYDINYDVLSVGHAGVSVTVETTENQTTEEKDKDKEKDKDSTTEEDKRSEDCDLSSLSISPGELSPAFSPETTSYTVQLTEEDKSIAISAITNSDKATTSVSGANSLEKGANYVTITVTAENGAVKEYYLTVMCGDELEEIKLKIDGHDFMVVMDELPEPPEGFTETVLTINNKKVPGFQAPNKRLSIICLKNEKDEIFWYIYDKDNTMLTPYQEVPAEKGRYVILNKPESFDVPNGFKPAELKIGTTAYKAYSDGTGSGVFLIYAMNLNGEAGYYLYDSKDRSFMRFAAVESLIASKTDAVKVEPATNATATEAPAVAPIVRNEKEENGLSRSALKKLLIAMTVLFVIMCIAVIVLVVRNSSLMNKIDPEDMTDDENDNPIIGAEAKKQDQEKTSDAEKAVAEEDKEKFSKNKSYGVNEDTGEIMLETASDFNSNVNVPLAKEEREDKIESAKKERPFGIDSAFDVVAGDADDASGFNAEVIDKTEVQAAVEAEDEIKTEASAAAEIENKAEAAIEAANDTKKAEAVYTEVFEKPAKKVVLPGQDDEEE